MNLVPEPFAPRRRPGLTPMIDVVFLLLVFFMLVSQFGFDGHLPLRAAGNGGSGDAGPPRLIEIAPNALRLNGVGIAEADLPARLAALTEAPTDIVVLRAAAGTDLQRLVDVIARLGAAGFANLALVE